MDEAGDDALARLAMELRTLRHQRGLKISGLQQRTGLGRTTISRALSGHSLPSEATVLALAEALRTAPSALLELRRQADGRPARRRADRRGRSTGTRAGFDTRYLRYVAERHARLTVVGLDLSHPGRSCWPLDAAYLSLEVAKSGSARGLAEVDAQQAPVICRAEQGLAGHRRLLLSGLAGSGKTTLLQWLAVAAARGNLPESLSGLRGQIPFVLPLRTLMRRESMPKPDEFLSATGVPFADIQPHGWADGHLSDGALVLVDGVDEVPYSEREATREWLSQLLSSYEHSTFIVTTRPSAVPEGWLASLGFQGLAVRPMSSTDVRLFVSRWHRAAKADVDDAREQAHLRELEALLHVTVRAERDVAQLSTTPLMCALICALHRERRGYLPHSRMELYEAALSMLVSRRDRERGIGAPEGIELSEYQHIYLLQKLAYWLIRNQQTEMDANTARHLIADSLPSMPVVSQQGETEEVLAHLVARSGLLREPAVGTIDFVHRTFQDYLGAKAAVEALDLSFLAHHAHEPQLEDVVRMAVAHARPIERAEFLRDLVLRGDHEAEHRTRLHLLAAASLHYAAEVHPRTREVVTQRADDLMPPRSDDEADNLAALGPGILDLLPRSPHGLKDDEVRAVIRTASNIGGEAAYAILQQIADQATGLSPQFALVQAWDQFEAEAFARDMFSDLDERVNLYVRTHAQRDALAYLAPIRRVNFGLPLTSNEILEHLSAEHTTWLDIQAGPLLDLTFLRGLPALRELALRGDTQLTGLDGLASLPLLSLTLSDLPREFHLDALRDLVDLKELRLYTSRPCNDLTSLPASPDLTTLWLGDQVKSIVGISAWSELEDVVVNHNMREAEWGELASLSYLTRLNGRDLTLPLAPEMPNITYLGISPDHGDLSLYLIPQLFPNLERLVLQCRAHWAPDLSPLLALENLHVTINGYSGDLKFEKFPEERLTRHPRPRRQELHP